MANPARPPYTTYLVPPLSPLPQHPTSPFSGHATPRLSSMSVPSTPFLTPHHSSTNIPVLDMRTKRLLMPTVRSPRPSTTSGSSSGDAGASPRSKHKHSASKLIRARSGSASLTSSPDVSIVPECAGALWLGEGRRFDVAQEQFEIERYQLYAVEKWIVERRPVTVLTVFTGNPEHRITVTALSLAPSLTPSEAQVEWEKALHDLRRDGARPKETDKGTLMVTSLANFRSDFTIVHIPEGNFLDICEQLYTNINLLRMGCSGRSALTLEEPSDTTKDRFISMYHFPTKIRSSSLFNATVLELVKLIQAGLAICNMYNAIDHHGTERNAGKRCREIDGLLCDETAEGIGRWVAEIGEAIVGVEHMERLADPTVVSALLSLILTTRNKLVVIADSHVVPKDPFLDPESFTAALAHFQPAARTHHLSGPSSLTSSPNISSQTHNSNSTNNSNATSNAPSTVYLTRPLVDAISSTYNKTRHSESYKVHRVLLNKLDDLTTDLKSATTSSSQASSALESNGGVGGYRPTFDMSQFVRGIVSGDKKEGVGSLRWLWTGRVAMLQRRRLEIAGGGAWKKDGVRSDGEEKDGRDKEKAEKEKERERERGERTDGKTSESDGEGFGVPWGGRMQRKIESWAALSKKKNSVDLGRSRNEPVASTSTLAVPSRPRSMQIPAVIVSGEPGDEDEPLSSGQASPTSDKATRSFLAIGQLPLADTSASNISVSDYERRVNEFNQKRPTTKPFYQSRIVSWSDPVSARGIMDEDEQADGGDGGSTSGKDSGEKRRIREGVGARLARVSEHGEFIVEGTRDDLGVRQEREKPAVERIRRSRSFDDLGNTRVLPLERMRIDVELCGQMLIMRRRENHLENVLTCLHAITNTLSTTNASLREDYHSHQQALKDLEARAQMIAEIEAERHKIDAMMQETRALCYESEQFRVPELWYMAFPPRRKVIQLREKIFGTGGRRMPPGVHGAHGRFNRLQWTLDGQERLVDRYGRTESEVDEEEALPDEYGLNPLSDEEDVVEHQRMKPTWLLNLFNSWGNQWGLFTAKPKRKEKDVKERTSSESPEASTSTAVSLNDEHPPTTSLLHS